MIVNRTMVYFEIRIKIGKMYFNGIKNYDITIRSYNNLESIYQNCFWYTVFGFVFGPGIREFLRKIAPTH